MGAIENSNRSVKIEKQIGQARRFPSCGNDWGSFLSGFFSRVKDTQDFISLLKIVRQTLRKALSVSCISVVVYENGQPVSHHMISRDDRVLDFKAKTEPNPLRYQTLCSSNPAFLPVKSCPEPFLKNIFSAAGVESICCMLLLRGQMVLGVLTMGANRSGALGKDETGFCLALCGYLTARIRADLLERREQAMRQNQKHYMELFENIFFHTYDFICILDRDGRCLQASPSLIKKLGYMVPGGWVASASPIFSFVHSKDRAATLECIRALQQNGSVKNFRNRLVCKDGSLVYAEWNANYIANREEMIAISRDITKQKESEEKTVELEKSLQMERLKIDYYSNLSHELKTPLNIILSSLQLIETKGKASASSKELEEYQKYLQYIETNSYRLLRLVTNLIDSSKIDNHYLHLILGKYDIVKLISDTVSSSAHYAATKNVEMIFAPESSSCFLNCDLDKIDRIMLNLLSNAIKNTPSGGKIRVTLKEEADTVRVHVIDNGFGIKPQVLPYIFDRFSLQRLHIASKSGGSGVGLSIAKSLVEMHGGTIGATSEAEKGSDFYFTVSKNLSCTAEQAVPISGYDIDEFRKSRISMELSHI